MRAEAMASSRVLASAIGGDAACDDPLSGEGGVGVASARATQSSSCRSFSSEGRDSLISSTFQPVSRDAARARESQNVRVSYPRRIEIAPLQATQHAHLQRFR